MRSRATSGRRNPCSEAEFPSLTPLEENRRFGEIRKGYKRGPDDRWLRVIERDIDLGEDGRFIVAVAGPADEIDKDVRRFTAR